MTYTFEYLLFHAAPVLEVRYLWADNVLHKVGHHPAIDELATRGVMGGLIAGYLFVLLVTLLGGEML